MEQVQRVKAPRRASVRTRAKSTFPCPDYGVLLLLLAHSRYPRRGADNGPRFTKFVPETNSRIERSMSWFNETSQPHRTEQISGAVRLELGSYKPMVYRDTFRVK